jgi:hypothetical protein
MILENLHCILGLCAVGAPCMLASRISQSLGEDDE